MNSLWDCIFCFNSSFEISFIFSGDPFTSAADTIVFSGVTISVLTDSFLVKVKIVIPITHKVVITARFCRFFS